MSTEPRERALFRMPALGQCLGCKRILITDAYELCWRCACALIEAPMPTQAHADEHPEGFVERLYTDLGGGG